MSVKRQSGSWPVRRTTNLKNAALGALALALVGTTGCGGNGAGLVLVFPSDQDKAAATRATILVARPPSANGDDCPSYLGHPPMDPDGSNLETSDDVVLTNGMAQNKVNGIPTGRQTVLVKVIDSSTNIFLHGCKTTQIAAGDKIEIDLEALTPNNNDLSGGSDTGPVDDLTMPGPDMAQHHTLSITVTELRDSSRKQNNATVTVVDAMGATASGMTDANGLAKIDVTGMMLPLQATAMVPSTGVNAGSATVGGLMPTFAASGNTNVTLSVELDAPVAQAANAITVSPPPSATVDIFWVPVFGLPSDIQTTHVAATGTGAGIGIGPTGLAAGNFRVALTEGGGANPTQAATPSGVSAAGSPNPLFLNSGLANYGSDTYTVNVKHSGTGSYATQTYSVQLILPALPGQAAIPIVSPAPFVADTAETPHIPASPGSVQPAATMMAEQIGFGPSPAPRAESRMALTAGNGGSATFPNPVPEPPAVSPLPTPQPQASSFTIVATPPSGFPATSTLSFVHVHIYDALSPAGLYHWHIVVPAANPTTIVLPGGVIPVGSYTVDIAFVQDFMPLADGTVVGTLVDDYTKLLRALPQLLSQRTLGLTVN
jgi:hypothetical protein